MLAGSILGYLALFFILRYMGAESYGILGFGLAYVGLFAFITDLGFNHAHIKRVSEGKDLKKCIGTFFIVKLALTGIMVGIVLVSIFFWKVILGRGFEYPEHETVIYLSIIYYAILGLSALPLSTYSARRETAKQQLPGFVEPIVRAPLAIVIAIGSLGVLALTGAYVLGVCALLITSIILFRSYPFGKFDSVMFRSYFKFAIPIALSSSIVVISANVDKVMLQLFWGSRFVGYYYGVQRLTAFLILVSMAVTMLLFPTLSEHHGKKDYPKIRKLTTTAERYVSMIVLPITMIFIVFSKPILFLFREEIAENAATTLQIMSIYSLLYCFYLIFLNQIMAVDKPRLGAKIGITMAVINICLNVIFIPKDIKSLGITLLGMGAEGAALATAISAACGLILCKIYTRKLTGTKWNPRILMHLGAAIITGFALYFLINSIPILDLGDPQWAGIIELLKYGVLLGLLCLLGIGIYIAILVALREFKKDDFKLFLNLMNPKEMGRYVISELRNKENNYEEGSDSDENEDEKKELDH
jgi:O-antigen/teichoic acid export membrane protein